MATNTLSQFDDHNDDFELMKEDLKKSTGSERAAKIGKIVKNMTGLGHTRRAIHEFIKRLNGIPTISKNNDSKNDDSKNDDSKNNDSKNNDSKNNDSKKNDSEEPRTLQIRPTPIRSMRPSGFPDRTILNRPLKKL